MGKVSLIAKRQENIMTNQLLDDREKYLHNHLSLKQNPPSPTINKNPGFGDPNSSSLKKQSAKKAMKSPKELLSPASSGPNYRLSSKMVERLE